MTRQRIGWTIGAVAIATALVDVAARQVMIQNSDVVRIGNGGSLGGPSDKPLIAGTGLIVGQALDTGSKRGLADALVTLQLPGYLPAQVLADADGRFVFRDLPAGKFNLTLTHPGYADGAYGRLRPAGPTQALSLAADQRMGDVTVPLWKFGAVAGTVLDENGDPLVGAQVRVLRQVIVAGKRQLQQAGNDTADDRGMYRIGSLLPGDYLVVLPMTPPASSPLDALLGPLSDRLATTAVAFAGGGGGGGGGGGMSYNMQVGDFSGAADSSTAAITDDGHVLSYPTTFFPTAASPTRATLITLLSGDDHAGLDFQLRPTRTAKVSGTITGPDGSGGNLSVTLTPADYEDLVTPIGAPTTMTDGSGRFSFAGVPPGNYILRAVKSPQSGDMQITRSAGGGMMVTMSRVVVNGNQPPLPTDNTFWAETSVPVASADITALAIGLRPAIKVGGTIAFNGAAVKPTGDQLNSISISLEAADGRTAVAGGSARGRVDQNGTFQTMGVPPGKCIVRVQGGPQGWSFYGAMTGGRDVSVEPLEITSSDVNGIALTFTDRPASLGGTVTNASGAADPAASVVVFPTEPDGWAGHGASPRRIRVTRVASDGTYNVSNLPSGKYFVAAVSDSIASDANPQFLQTLTRLATRVDVADGEQKKQALQSVTPGVR